VNKISHVILCNEADKVAVFLMRFVDVKFNLVIICRTQ